MTYAGSEVVRNEATIMLNRLCEFYGSLTVGLYKVAYIITLGEYFLAITHRC